MMKKQTKKAKIKKAKLIITKDMSFDEVMRKYPETAKVFLKHGLTCIGCPFALQETIEQGSLAHGINVNALVKELNRVVEKKSDRKVKNDNIQ